MGGGGRGGGCGRVWKVKLTKIIIKIPSLCSVCYIDHLSEEGRGEVQEVLDELVASRKGEGGEVEVAL